MILNFFTECTNMSNEMNQLILRLNLDTLGVDCLSPEVLEEMVKDFDREIQTSNGQETLDYFNDPANNHPVLSTGILNKIVKKYWFDSEYEVYVIQL